MPAPSEPGQRRPGRAILLACVLLALAGSVAYNWYSSRQSNVKARLTKSTDFIATWRCLECDFEEEATAGPGPRVCPHCSKEAFYVSVPFSCPKHGTYVVAFNYDENGKPSMVKVGKGAWVPHIDENGRCGEHCPICDALMIPAASTRIRTADDEQEAP